MSDEPANRPLLLLWGFMGAGKSTVGRALAECRSLPFVDLDERIERDAGARIAAIIDERGESAFRSLEAAALCAEFAGSGPRVVALGGGALLDGSLRREALERAFVVNLVASPETIVQRTRGSGRPLLRDPSEAAVERLLAQRAPAYDHAHLHVTTDGREVSAVVDEVDRAWRPPAG